MEALNEQWIGAKRKISLRWASRYDNNQDSLAAPKLLGRKSIIFSGEARLLVLHVPLVTFLVEHPELLPRFHHTKGTSEMFFVGTSFTLANYQYESQETSVGIIFGGKAGPIRWLHQVDKLDWDWYRLAEDVKRYAPEEYDYAVSLFKRMGLPC
jgi:hypothetical protein